MIIHSPKKGSESIIDGLFSPVERLNHIAMRQGCLLILSQISFLNCFAQYFKPGLFQERVLLITLHSN